MKINFYDKYVELKKKIIENSENKELADLMLSKLFFSYVEEITRLIEEIK